jgi:hypothetical protein
MKDMVRLEIVMTRSALDALVSCANVGYEGLEGNLADIDDVGDLLDKLQPIPESPNNGVFIHHGKGECRVFIADDEWVQRGFEEELAEPHTYQDEQDRSNGVESDALAG